MSELEGSLSCSSQCAETQHNTNTGDINPETVQITNTNNSQVDQESQRDSDLLKSLLTDNFCHICEASLLYESQRVSHYEGKKHAQKVRLYLQNKKAESNKRTQECGGFVRGLSADPDKFCELCNMVFSSHTVAKSHYVGKVHAKNLRKTNPPQIIVSTPTLESATPVVQPAEVAVPNHIAQEQKDSSGVGDQEVDLSDPNKFCSLCSSSFNNPVVAQQHYSGRKHQRNQARQQMLDQIGDQSEHVSSLTCPICCLTLSSVEMYKAHMQGNKHQMKEKKVMELCKSQKKVYDSYQDELADYIQVQKARGLDPKAGLGTVGQASKDLDETVNESPQTEELMPHPAPLLPPLPGFHQPNWPPQFQSQVNHFGFGMRGPVPHYQPGYMPHPPPHFIPGQLYKRGRGPDSCSSSSYSDSSYTSSSGSESSSSYDSRERRKTKRKMRKRGMKRRDQEDEADMNRRGREREEQKKRLKGDRRDIVEGEGDRETRKCKKSRKRERSLSEDEESRSRRRQSRRSKRHGDGQHAKRQKEAELIEKEEVELAEEKTEAKDGKQKHKKDKKKGKEKVNQEDNRTEEERLWDETILGIF
ncbi:zinc finger matrin-type protein 1 isoform X2 [Myxocyprinus asiaticus]|uniref:zinc finger matrin-type protein 1 isoform X2 n=1 Tax=Myxocyprinus asiaticus TaxID=70543 RepID=UPI0022217E8A|nr:zinc finger matrin-type protein 1 isoform X2 [Myxocyprinus asiaticus]